MWTLETVNAYALKRGELQDQRDAFRAALLAQERARGRVETPYSEQDAAAELERALEQLGAELPSPRDGEYPGLDELRDQALAQQRSREAPPPRPDMASSKPYSEFTAPQDEHDEDEDERDR